MTTYAVESLLLVLTLLLYVISKYQGCQIFFMLWRRRRHDRLFLPCSVFSPFLRVQIPNLTVLVAFLAPGQGFLNDEKITHVVLLRVEIGWSFIPL